MPRDLLLIGKVAYSPAAVKTRGSREEVGRKVLSTFHTVILGRYCIRGDYRDCDPFLCNCLTNPPSPSLVYC
jgi:hypothetical protein